ncbi:hypothetical protein JYU34_015175 [Plutella xylostella]|uniref:Uncharacterized protein n=1 Tax=Plutella xylostella TaxID=51655 RepID=A0ABQ7Q6H4_PLUXY|nr:hypothetical protein JYU34_015175 [Plutella xylostella]
MANKVVFGLFLMLSRTPPMVETRSAVKRAQQQGCEPAPPNIPTDADEGTRVLVSRRKSSSVQARRKRLDLEAAEQKAKIQLQLIEAAEQKAKIEVAEQRAKIQLELIEKRLQAEYDDLDEEEDNNYSPRSEGRSSGRVERWLDQSHQQTAQPAHDYGTGSGGPCPPPSPAPAAAGSAAAGDNVQLLAAALMNLTTAAATKAVATAFSGAG